MKENLHQDDEEYDESDDRRLRGVNLDRLVRDQNHHGCDRHEYHACEFPQDEVLVGLWRVVECPLNAREEQGQELELLT